MSNSKVIFIAYMYLKKSWNCTFSLTIWRKKKKIFTEFKKTFSFHAEIYSKKCKNNSAIEYCAQAGVFLNGRDFFINKIHGDSLKCEWNKSIAYFKKFLETIRETWSKIKTPFLHTKKNLLIFFCKTVNICGQQ